MSTPEPLITVTNLGHSYAAGQPPALDGVSLTIPRGSCFGLLGPNGAGKSTLISLLTGVLAPQSGEIRINGEIISRNSKTLKKMSAIAPQDLAFYPRLNVRENLEFFAGAYGLSPDQRRTRMMEVTRICDLDAFMARKSSDLSGGVKRRLNLAIALLNAPNILYLDEPTVGIDARSRQTIIDAIAHLNAKGATIIYTSHYMEEVEALCDEIGVIDGGRLIARDTTQNLLGATGLQTLRIRLADDLDPARMAALRQVRLLVSSPRDVTANLHQAKSIADVILLLNAQGCKIERLSYGVQRLEDVYLALLKKGAAT